MPRKPKNDTSPSLPAAHQVKNTHAMYVTKKSSLPPKMRNMTKMRHASRKKRKRTKFEEYLEMETKKTMAVSADMDLDLEKKLGKKLKVKDGLLGGVSDGLFDLLEGTASLSGNYGKSSTGDSSSEDEESEGMLDESSSLADRTLEDDSDLVDEDHDGRSEQQDADDKSPSDSEENVTNCSDTDDNLEVDVKPLAKYVAPHLRSDASLSSGVSQLQRRCRGLLNRLSEENVEPIAQEIVSFFQIYGRRDMIDIVTNEIMIAICSGPRGNEQYAAVFAAFVAGIACMVGVDFGAKFLASLARNFQEYREKEDNLAVRNMSLLLSYIYIFKLVSCDVIYDLLCSLSKTLLELDVATILTILQTCGMGMRADDPTAMKDFILSVQHRHEEMKAAALESGSIFSCGKRMDFMLDTIYEIKNNKRRAKPESIPHGRLKKWLQTLRIEEVQLRSLTWKRLLDSEKKGQWWISASETEDKEGIHAEVVDIIHKESLEADKLLQLAATQRMNTDIRRAIFCVVMSGEDYLDAFEKILRIKLSGKQDREIIRVIVECCMQEKAFNKYYALLIAKLCHHDKNHKFTLQYCFWDHFKQLDSMEARRIRNLAYLLAELIANFVLSLSVLKVVQFMDMQMTSLKVIMFFRIFFKILLTKYSDEVVWNAFKRIAANVELEGLRVKLTVFLHQQLVKGTQRTDSRITDDRITQMKRFALVKKAMTSSTRF